MKDLELAIKAAKLGGKIIMKHYDKPDVHMKGAKNPVTNADTETEKAVRELLLSKTSYSFIGEETGSKAGHGKTWAIDPIDGTKMFILGVPHFSISISLLDGKRTELGVVLNPATGDLFHAEAGKGSFRNGKKLKIADKEKLKDAMVTCCFAYDRFEMIQRLNNATTLCLAGMSAALDICNVAAGKTDATVYGLTNVYDHAGAALIAQEAGAAVSNFGMQTWDPYTKGIIASKKGLAKEITSMFPKPLDKLTPLEKAYTQG